MMEMLNSVKAEWPMESFQPLCSDSHHDGGFGISMTVHNAQLSAKLYLLSEAPLAELEHEALELRWHEHQ